MVKKVSVTCIAFLFLASSFVMAQKPAPYSQLDPGPYDPETDADIDMYIGNWRESVSRYSHGTLIERDFLTKCDGDPLNPPRKGAVLKYINSFSYASLIPDASTQPTTLKGEQEIFYILSGRGIITAGRQKADLYNGIHLLMPANLTFTITNTGDEPLTMLLVNEPVPEGFRPNEEMLVRDENAVPFLPPGHWSNIAKKLFLTEDGLGTLQSMYMVVIDPMTIAQPHSHVEGCEEAWVVIDGPNIAFLGKQLRKMEDGTAYLVPPDGATPHANLNTSDKPIKLLCFARYGDHEVRK